MTNSAQDLIHKTYGNRIRIRACGILVKDNAILLLKHEGIGKKGFMWSPPGGGLEFSEEINTTLIREFKEECKIDILVEDFLFFNESIHPPLHAIELFFKVTQYDETPPKLGNDPETSTSSILSDIAYFNYSEIRALSKEQVHPILLSPKLKEVLK